MATTQAANTFHRRLLGAVMLDPEIYEDVEADRAATRQACATVIMSGVAAGVGAGGVGASSLSAVAFVSAVALVSWLSWAIITFEIGVWIMPQRQTRATVGQLSRTLGFAAAPGCLRVLGLVPGATIPVFAVTAVWMLAAMVVAVRQALDYESTVRAVALCAVGWLFTIVIAITLGLAFGPVVS